MTNTTNTETTLRDARDEVTYHAEELLSALDKLAAVGVLPALTLAAAVRVALGASGKNMHAVAAVDLAVLRELQAMGAEPPDEVEMYREAH